MNGPSEDRPAENQAARIRPVLWVLFDNLTRAQGLQDLIDSDRAKRLGLHLLASMIGEATLAHALTDFWILH